MNKNTKPAATSKTAKAKKATFDDDIADDGSIMLPCSSGKSLEQTLKSCGVDESKWIVDHYTIEENTRGYNFKVYLKKKEYLGQSLTDLKKELAQSCQYSASAKYKTRQNGLLLNSRPLTFTGVN
jgi:hypothetical protein